MKETKEHIIIVASRLFMQKSFKEVTMNEIVEETGLSKGAFYYYFQSKENLFSEVLAYFFTNVMTLTYDAYSKETLYHFYHEIAKGIQAVSRFYIDKLRGDMDSGEMALNYFTLMFDAIKLFPEVKAKIIEQQENDVRKWTEVIKMAKDRGEIVTNISDEMLAKMFLSISDGVLMQKVVRGIPFDEMVIPFVEIWDQLYEQIKAR